MCQTLAGGTIMQPMDDQEFGRQWLTTILLFDYDYDYNNCTMNTM